MDHRPISEIAKRYTYYDMIELYTDLPAFPEQRVNLLCYFLSRSQPSISRHTELYCLAASLVQVGMDMHDWVDTGGGSGPSPEVRSRQLRVLAGDYFSGRFYQLLSQAGQIDLVHRLSEAICDVNRLKLNLYEKMKQTKLSAEEYLQATVEIRSRLFLAFSALMDRQYRASWPELLRHITTCEVLSEEMNREDISTPHSWVYWHLRDSGGTAVAAARQFMGSLLDHHWKHTVQRIKQLEPDKWLQDVLHFKVPGMKLAERT